MEEFTQSVYFDVVKALGDESAAHAVLNDMGGDVYRDSKVDDLSKLFPAVPRDTLVYILTMNNWDCDQSIEPLFEAMESIREHQVEYILQGFMYLPRETYDEVIQNSEGDIEEAVLVLIRLLQHEGLIGNESIENIVLERIAATIRRLDGPDSEAPKSTELSKTLKIFCDETVLETSVPIEVTWSNSVDGEISTYDWIAMYEISENDLNQYYTYHYVPSTESNGSIKFVSPTVFGEYLFKYLSKDQDGNFVSLAESTSFKVGPTYTLCANMIHEEGIIEVTWNQENGNQYSSAWIGIYKKKENSNRNYITYEYIANKDRITFDIPSTAGVYEIRVVPTSYMCSARTSVVIEGNDELYLTLEDTTITIRTRLQTVDPTSENIWIGIYHVTENRYKYYRRYKYLQAKNEVVSFKRLVHDGEYEARLFESGSDDTRCRSNSITIFDNPTPELYINRAKVVTTVTLDEHLLVQVHSDKLIDIVLDNIMVFEKGSHRLLWKEAISRIESDGYLTIGYIDDLNDFNFFDPTYCYAVVTLKDNYYSDIYYLHTEQI
eukprot:TRINITY_DN5527_c3_g1_i1.p1 TRINITY_DN5527_c3_g1~~TRINITY_DN5527_c3_g1_i1.p1  ORF type:complete len:574 (-),score=137.35 TRINITY_DN5527_c3_g1_i1:20-1666(-)